MAHNLFGDRFYSLRRPAWHGLGNVLDQELGATKAFDLIGAYDVRLEAITTASGLACAQKAVVRSATDDDPQERVLSIVGEDYNLVTPRQVVKAWDAMIERPVETIGSLDKGATIFVSTKLPTLDVNGDEVENYMLLSSPMTGNDAIWLRVTPVRVVCQNTLIAAASASTEKHRIVHDSRAEERMKLWLEHVYTKAVEKMNLMNRAFRAMADTPVTTADRDNVIEFVYTMPKMPIRAEMPETVYVEAVQTFEYQRERTLRRREAVREIFDGKGYGMDTPAARGTAWGLYNAVVEFSDYCGSGKGQAVAESALTGDRARDKEKAYGACAKLADKR